jgi:hypothetical protein
MLRAVRIKPHDVTDIGQCHVDSFLVVDGNTSNPEAQTRGALNEQ